MLKSKFKFLNVGSTYKIFNIEHKISNKCEFDKDILMTNKIILEQLYISLKYTTQFLEYYNIDYCIISGTLLGQYRHSGFIPWDNDYDIMIFKDGLDKLNIIWEEYNKGPFQILPQIPGFKLFYNDMAIGELFVYDYHKKIKKYKPSYPYVDNEPQFYTGDFMFNWLQYEYNDIFPLKKEKFEDMYIYTPNNIENILNINYPSNNLYKCIYSGDHSYVHQLLNYDVFFLLYIFEIILKLPFGKYIYLLFVIFTSIVLKNIYLYF